MGDYLFVTFYSDSGIYHSFFVRVHLQEGIVTTDK